MNDNHYLFKCATFFILLVSSFWQNSKLVSVETWRETIETYTWLELWILFPPFFVRFRRSRSRNNSTIKQRLHLPKNRETTFETDEFIYIFCTDNIFFFVTTATQQTVIITLTRWKWYKEMNVFIEWLCLNFNIWMWLLMTLDSRSFLTIVNNLEVVLYINR
jgi:hypothetical protein